MSAAAETRVLICMDGSKYADYAFEFYMANMHKPTDYVILYHSLEYHLAANIPMGVGSADLLSSMMQEEKERSEKYLTELADKMKARNLHGKVKQTTGPPRTEVIKAAEEENAAYIVTGTRGMGTVRRSLLGSVSDHVIHHSHVPVLVCRHKEH